MELAFLGMELHQPFLTPIVFLEDLCVGNAVDGSVDDGVISEEPDVGAYAVSDVVDIHQEEGWLNTEPCSTPDETGQGSDNTPPRTTH